MAANLFNTLCIVFAASNVLSHAEAREGAQRNEKIQPRFAADDATIGPFPSDLFAVPDLTQNTGLHINLRPTCEVLPTLPSECVENNLLNELDGFHVQPRLTIAFSGPIDLATVNSATIFLVKLGSTLANGSPPDYAAAIDDEEEEGRGRLPADAGWVVGIDRGVWDPDTSTLYVTAAEILEQHTRYALIVTRGVLDMSGRRIEQSKDFKRFRGEDGDDGAVFAPAQLAYRRALRLAVTAARVAAGHEAGDVAVASVFSTMSVSALLEKLRAHVAARPAPRPAEFRIGPNGARTVFDVANVTGWSFNRQTKVALTQPLSPSPNNATRLPTLKIVPGAVRLLAFGTYSSPNYLKDRFIPPMGTFSGVPQAQSLEDVHFTLFVPSGEQPATGWPVVIWSHGGGDNTFGGPVNIAAKLASHGLAMITINTAFHGFGPQSTFTVTRPAASGGPMTFLSGGRGLDVNKDSNIDSNEGAQAGPPKGLLLARNSHRQTAVDLMQLIRVIEVGIDVDGDRIVDLDASRIYFGGSSDGAIVGTILFAVEPRLRAATLTGLGGWRGLWTSPVGRGGFGVYFQNRNMLNPPGTPVVTSLGGVALDAPFYNDNLPVRGAAPLVNDIPGALAMQQVEERADWLSNSANPGAFAPYLRLSPLPGVRSRPFLIQESRGDQNVPNPHTAEVVRAGLFADRVTLYRHDLFASKLSFKNPHSFIIRTDLAVMQNVALAAQEQLARFFASDGSVVIDPALDADGNDADGSDPLFEVPASSVPDDFGFIL
jgi:hypothetical protein